MLSVLLNVFLTVRVHSLTPRPPTLIAVGSKLNDLQAQDLSGRKVTVAFNKANRPIVLYVFSPTCQWCAKNYNNIIRLNALRQSDYRFVAVSLSTQGLNTYVMSKKFTLEVIQQLAEKDISDLHLDETPETIVVDRTGTVTKVWAGAYNAKKCREIEAFFRLPPNTLSDASETHLTEMERWEAPQAFSTQTQ